MAFGAQIKLSVDKSNKSQFRGQIQQLVSDATSRNPVKVKNITFDLQGPMRTQLSKQLSDAIEKKEFRIKINSIDASAAVENLRRQLTKMLGGLQITGVREFLGESPDTKKLAESLDRTAKKAKEASAAIKEINSIQASLNSANKKLLDMGTGEEVERLKEKYRELSNTIQQAKSMEGEAQQKTIQAASAEVSALNEKINTIKQAERAAVQAAKEEANAEKQAAKERERNTREQEAAANKQIESLRKIDALLDQINKKLSSNPKTKTAYGEQIDNIISKLQKLRGETERGAFDEKSFLGARGEWQKVLKDAGETGSLGKTIWNVLAEGWQKFGTWAVVTRSMTIAVNTIKKMVSAVKEVDKAMTELRKVTDLTASSYDKLYQRVANTSREIGASVSDMINAVADFARLGFGVADAEQLAKAAVVYKNVGDGIDDISQATESIISTMKAFGVEASNSMRIVDEFNEVGNRFAISSTGIGDALQRSAAALAAAGNTLEESIGMIVAANNVVQNPDTVGTSLKTISMYLRAAKTEAEEAGIETEGMAESVSKLREELLQLTNQKVDIQLDENTFKSTYQILKELSKVWNDISDISRANIMEKLGGKRGGNVVSALLTNFADAEAAMKTALDSAGSAMKENEKWLDSIEGRTERLSAAFQKMSNAVLGSDIVGAWVSFKEVLADIVVFINNIKLLTPLLIGSLVAVVPLVKALAKGRPLAEGFAGIGVFAKTTAGKVILALSAITAAIGLITKALEPFSYSGRVDAANARVDELRQKYEETENEIKSLNTELDETIERMNELSGKDSLTIVEKDELETLKSTNIELKARIENLKLLAQIQNRELAEGIRSKYREEYQSDVLSSGIFGDNSTYNKLDKIARIVGRINQYGINELAYDMLDNDVAHNPGFVNQEKFIEKSLEWITEARQKIKELNKELPAVPEDQINEYIKQLDGLKEKYNEVEEYLAYALQDYQDNIDEYSKYSTEDETYEMLRGWADKISRVLSPALYREEIFNKIINSDEFVKDVDKIRAAQQEGNEVTVETIRNYEDLSVALEQAGITLEEAAEQFNATAVAAKSAADAVSAYEKLSANVKGISTAAEAMNKVFGDQSYGTSITVDQYNQLIEADKDFVKCIENTNGYMQLNIQAAKQMVAEKVALEQASIAAAKAQRVEEYKQNTDAIAANQLALSLLKNTYAETSEEYENGRDELLKTIETLGASNTQILQEIQGYDRLASELDYATSAYKRWIDAQNSPEAGDQYDSMKTAVQQLKDGLESGKIGTNVFKSAAELLIPEWNEGDVAAVNAYMEKLERYFTEDSAGLQHFIDDMFKSGFLDDMGDSYLMKAGTTVEQIADKMGLTVDATRYMLQALQDYGWKVDILNKEYNTADLISQYEAATAAVEEAQAALDRLVESGAGEEERIKQTQELAAAEKQAAEAKAALDAATGEAPKSELDLLKDQLEQLKDAYEILADLKIGGEVNEEFTSYINNISSVITMIQGLEGALKVDVTPGDGIEGTVTALEKVRDAVRDVLGLPEVNIDVTDTIPDDLADRLGAVKEGAEGVETASGPHTVDVKPGDNIAKTIVALAAVRKGLQTVADNSGIEVNVTDIISDETIEKIAVVESGVEAIHNLSTTNPNIQITTSDDLSAAAENAEKIRSAIEALTSLEDDGILTREITLNMAGDFYDKFNEIQEAIEAYEKKTSEAKAAEKMPPATPTTASKIETAQNVIHATQISDAAKEATKIVEDATEEFAETAEAIEGEMYERSTNFLQAIVHQVTEMAFGKEIADAVWGDVFGNEETASRAREAGDIITKELRKNDDGVYEPFEIGAEKAAEKGAAAGISNGITEASSTKAPSWKALQEGAQQAGQDAGIKFGEAMDDAVANGAEKGFANAWADPNTWSPVELKIDTSEAEEKINDVKELAEEPPKMKYYEYDSGEEAIHAFEAELRATNGNIDAALSNLSTTWQKVKDDYIALQGSFDGFEIEPDIDEAGFKEKIRELYGYEDEPVEIKVDANSASAINTANTAVKTISGKTATFKVYGKYMGMTGLSSALGLKFLAKGTDNAKEEDAIVGEKGVETWIHDGKFRTVGNNGPELVHLSKGDQILNNLQTRMLFGSKKSFSGNAYETGTSSNPFAGIFSALQTGVKAATSFFGNIVTTAFGKLDISASGEKTIGNQTSAQNTSKQVKDVTKSVEDLNKELEHLIEHQEQLYKEAERAMDFPGMQASLEEQARLYRQIMESSYAAVDEMRKQGKTDTDEDLQDMERAAWSAYESMYDAFDKIRALYTDSLHEKIDDIQTGYNNLKNVMDEIKDNGGISVDTFQALAEHGLQYLSFLQDANGQYKINTDAVKNMVAAEKEQLAIETALSYISSIQEALQDGQGNRIAALVDATQQISDNSWSAVYAQAALLKDMGLTDDQYDQVIFNINALRDLSGQVITDLSTGVAEAEKTIKEVFQETKNELDHLIEHQEQLYAEAERGLDFGGMEASLREQARIYKQIMDEAYAAVEEMKRQGMTDTDEDLQEMERAAWAAYASMNDAFDQMRALYTEALHEKLDNIQKGYEDLKNVMDEMTEQGGITVDTFQELAEHGLQYMSFLRNADGQYEINTERIQALVAAEKEQLAVETALSYVNSIQEALSEGQLNRVNALVDATQQIGDNTWNAVYAQAAMLKSLGLTDEQYDQVIFNIEALRNLSGQVITDISEKVVEEEQTIKEMYDDLNSQLDHLIEHQQQLYTEAERGMDYTGMEASLQEQARLYKQIMENAYRAVDEMKQQGMTDMDEDVQAMERTAWSAYKSMNDAFDQIRALQTNALNSKIDDIQTGYRNLKDAMDEIAESGGITMDTFQALTQHGLQYLSFLEGANGQYEINTASIQRMIEAEKEQLAIETALSYLSNLQEALQNGQDNRIAALVDATQQISDNSWNAVYAQAALLREMGLTQEQYDQVIFNIEALRNLAGEVITDISDKEEENFDDQKDALDKILKYTEDLVKAETQGRIKNIEKEVKSYQKIIDLKKESLRISKDQDKYERDVADKVEAIAKLQSQIDRLSLDDSRSAKAQRAKLIEELAELQGDLTDYQADHAYEAQVSTLDKMAQSYEEERQKEIDILESSISSTEKVYQMALERIRTSWSTLYTDLIEWNTEQGNVINQEITENWNLAGEAVQRYGSYLRALQELGGFDVGGSLAVLPKYHGGGIVGDAGSINDNEAMAILQKGEAVLDDTKKKGLYRIIDFQKTISDKLGTAVGNIALAGSSIMQSLGFGGITSERSVDSAQSVVYSPTINVAINHNGSMSGEDARRYGKDIADTALDRMYSAFERRGVSGIFGTRLKQA